MLFPTNDEIGAFAASMSQLESLYLAIDPLYFDGPPTAAFGAISNIARGCPGLRHLGIFINTDPQLIPEIEDDDPTFVQIQIVNFGLSTVVEVFPTVLFLARACGLWGSEIKSRLSASDLTRRVVPPLMRDRIYGVRRKWEEVADKLDDLQEITRLRHEKIRSLEENQGRAGSVDAGSQANVQWPRIRSSS